MDKQITIYPCSEILLSRTGIRTKQVRCLGCKIQGGAHSQGLGSPSAAFAGSWGWAPACTLHPRHLPCLTLVPPLLLSNKKECSIDTCYNTDKFQNNCAEGKKSTNQAKRVYTVCFHLYCILYNSRKWKQVNLQWQNLACFFDISLGK